MTISLEETLELARQAFPRSYPVRSSHSEGAHRWLVFKEWLDFEELKWLLRLKLQRMDLGTVKRGEVVFERVEVPDEGCRMPFGAGSYPLEGGFSEDDSPIAMLEHFFGWAKRNKVSKRQLFGPELAAVYRWLKAEQPGRSSWTAEDRARAARELYFKEVEKVIPPAPKEVVQGVLNADPFGQWFATAPAWVRQRYAIGIPAYGTRTKTTLAIIRWLAARGLDAEYIEQILEHWLEGRQHQSKDLEGEPENVFDQLPKLIKQVCKRRPEATALTTGDVRWLLDHMVEIDGGRAPSWAPPRLRRDPGPKQQPRREGTHHYHRLRLAAELIVFLRAAGGRREVSATLLKRWGGREYSLHVRHWVAHKLIAAEDPAAEGISRTYRLLLDPQPGELVANLADGLRRWRRLPM